MSRKTWYRVRYGNGNAYIAKVEVIGTPEAKEEGEEYFDTFFKAKKYLRRLTRQALEDAKSIDRIVVAMKDEKLEYEDY